MTKDEQIGQRIAKRVMRQLLTNGDSREDMKQECTRDVDNYRQALYTRKHVNIYCRNLAAALRKMK